MWLFSWLASRPWAGRLAARARALATSLLISSAFVLVPFSFALGKIVIKTAQRWEREQVRVSSDRTWLQDVLTSDERKRRQRVKEVWGRICLSICRHFRGGRGMPLDLGAWYRVMVRHANLYNEMKEEARGCALSYDEVDALPSLTGHFAKDVLCAMRHSRAAYGYRQSPGLLGAVTSWLWHKTKRQSAFPEQVRSATALEIARISREDMVVAEWSCGVYQPCFYVAIDRRHRLIVVAIRGTVNYADILTDAASLPIEVELDGRVGYMHEGMLKAAGYILSHVQNALKVAAAKAPGWPVLICGHSLGAGVAALLAVLLNLPENEVKGVPLGPIRCIAFGCPAVTCEVLAPYCRDIVTSVVVGADAVPRFGHASTDKLISEAAHLSALRRATSVVGHGFDTFLRRMQHQRSLARQATLERGLSIVDCMKAPVQLYPAGRILWCLPGEHPFVSECRLEWVRDFLLHVDCVSHHTPDFYVTAVQAIGDTLAKAPSQAAYLKFERMASTVPSLQQDHWVQLAAQQPPGRPRLASRTIPRRRLPPQQGALQGQQPSPFAATAPTAAASADGDEAVQTTEEAREWLGLGPVSPFAAGFLGRSAAPLLRGISEGSEGSGSLSGPLSPASNDGAGVSGGGGSEEGAAPRPRVLRVLVRGGSSAGSASDALVGLSPRVCLGSRAADSSGHSGSGSQLQAGQQGCGSSASSGGSPTAAANGAAVDAAALKLKMRRGRSAADRLRQQPPGQPAAATASTQQASVSDVEHRFVEDEAAAAGVEQSPASFADWLQLDAAAGIDAEAEAHEGEGQQELGTAVGNVGSMCMEEQAPKPLRQLPPAANGVALQSALRSPKAPPTPKKRVRWQ